MALTTVIRRSASSIVPIAARFVGGQRRFNHHCGGSLFTAVNRTGEINPNNTFSFSSVFRFSSSASPALKRPRSDESLLPVIEPEIKCSEESFEEIEEVPQGFPFELDDQTEQQVVSLSREYQGETIDVEVEPSSLVTGEEDEDDDDADDDTEKDNQSSVPMVVKVSKKGGPCLEFGVTNPDEIVIYSLSVKDPGMTDDQLPYEGPRFVSTSTVPPLAALFSGCLMHYHHRGASFMSVSRYSTSASPELNRPSSNEALSESSNQEPNPLKGPSRRSGLNENLRKVFEKYAETRRIYRSVFYEEKNRRKRKLKKIELPTHYMEVNYRTLKAVVFYGPNMGHIPHRIKSKELNALQ